MKKELTVIAFFVALLTAAAFTPLVTRLALKTGAKKIPKDERHIHKEPVALLGGLAIYLGLAVALILVLSLRGPGLRHVAPLLVCGGMVLAWGTIDDLVELRAWAKLVGQIAAASLAWWWGVRIEFLEKPFAGGYWYPEDWQSYAITALWLVGLTNAVNLIDGLDGLAAGVSAIAAATLTMIAWQHRAQEESPVVGVTAAALFGSALGFLRYNFNPAKIFMGDGGAQLLGFLLAAISVIGLSKSAAAVAIAAPVLVFGVPVFDVSFAIVRRLRNRQPIFSADRGHLHHRLLDKGLSQKQVAMVIYLISCLLCGVALLISARAG
jgi:UDP-GlcNAc:undecaprenyl-phosphate GlcNAc-1-phosphate transferase